MKVRSLLLVDDDPAVLQYLSCVLDEGGFQTRTAADGAACMDCVNQYPIDLVITDLVLRGAGDGLAIIRALKQSHLELPVILMSGAAQGGFAYAAKRLGDDLHHVVRLAQRAHGLEPFFFGHTEVGQNQINRVFRV